MDRNNKSAGGKYCVGGNGTEEIADESTKRSGDETEELASEEEAKTAGGLGRLEGR